MRQSVKRMIKTLVTQITLPPFLTMWVCHSPRQNDRQPNDFNIKVKLTSKVMLFKVLNNLYIFVAADIIVKYMYNICF